MLNLDVSNPFFTKNLYSLMTSSLFSSAGGFPKGLPYDLNSLLDVQRKNVKAVTEAQEIALKGMQKIARQHSDILSAIIENQSALISLFIQEGTPEDKIARSAELTKTQYTTAIQDIRGIQDTVNETIRNAADVLHHRTASNLSESQRQAIKTAMIPANSDEITKKKISA